MAKDMETGIVTQDEEETLVIFRVWPDTHSTFRSSFGVIKNTFKGNVEALLPEMVGMGSTEYECEMFSFSEGWNHGSYHGVVEQTRWAKPEEYAEMAAYLEKEWGYKLKIRRRWQPARNWDYFKRARQLYPEYYDRKVG